MKKPSVLWWNQEFDRNESRKQQKSEMNLVKKNNHLEQIKQIPEKIDPQIHGVHLEPCYKRYWCLVLIEIKLKTIIQIKETSSHVRCVESNSTIPENDWRWTIFTKVNIQNSGFSHSFLKAIPWILNVFPKIYMKLKWNPLWISRWIFISLRFPNILKSLHPCISNILNYSRIEKSSGILPNALKVH